MRASRRVLAIVCGVLALLAAPAAAQSDFQWRGQLAAGQSIEIKGINGSVHATRATSGEVEVTAHKTARRSNPADVRIDVVPHAGGVTICAVYPDAAGQDPNSCEPGGQGRSHNQNNDTVVDFEVHVPVGVGFIGRTVNGRVEADSLDAYAEGHTVNGSVHLSTAGLALASTVNGGVDVTMGRADWPSDAKFSTVNGGITLTLPAVVNAELDVRTVNGSISSEFPITVSGTVLSRRRLHGTLGAGGRALQLSTVNGSIELRKAP